QHRGEPEDGVGRLAGGRGDRLRQGEERPVDERVTVDQEELVAVFGGHASTLGAPPTCPQPGSNIPRACSAFSAPAQAASHPRLNRSPVPLTPSAQYSLTIRVEIDHKP